jgi:hypothetical protein
LIYSACRNCAAGAFYVLLQLGIMTFLLLTDQLISVMGFIKRVYNPNKGDTFLNQNSKALNQKINAKALRKAKKDTKGNCFRFLKYFFFAIFLYHSAPLR